MKTPLCMDVFASDGNTFLKFWCNGKCDTILSPIMPYCYSKHNLPSEASVTQINKQLLYDYKYKNPLYKYEFRTVEQLRESGNVDDYIEYNFPFKDRVYTDRPGLISKYANTDPLVVLYLDIETDTFLQFPTSKENAIIAIGMQFNDGPIEIIESETYKDDRFILHQMCELIKIHDPDVICTYNGTFFDMPYIVDRMKINGIDPGKLSRDGSKPYLSEKYVKLGGRVHFDIFTRSVDRDQNLYTWSPKNKKMKTVAKLYGLEGVVEEPQEMMANMRAQVGQPRLGIYLTSDIKCTKFLADIYLPAIIGMAETLNISLEACVNSSPAYIPSMLFSKHYADIGILSDMNVGQAHPYLSDTKAGALVGCFKPGLYKEKGLRKFDVQSYYPNLVRTLNLSPETCRIVRIDEEMQPYAAKMNHAEQILTLSIPDDKAKRQVIIEIDFSKRGFTSSFVDQAMKDRLEMKQKMKTLSHDSPEYASLDVNQLNLKVIMNSITGYFGMQYAAYGSLASYIAITGTGRYLISKLIEHVDSTVALDTDGIVIDSDEDIDETNAWLEKYVLDFFEVSKNYIQLEEEHFEAAYFRDGSKQYLLLEHDKQGNPHLVIHGISFKGSNLPKIFSSIIEEVGLQMLLVDETDKSAMRAFDDAIATHYDKNTWNLDVIKKRIKVKPVEQYASSGTIGGQLGVQYEKRFDTAITHPTQLEYVKVKRNHGSTYQLVTIFDSFEDIDGIDMTYYSQIVDSAFERLGLLDRTPRMKKAGKQDVLFDFDTMPAGEPRLPAKKKKSKKRK